jgi:Fibronectin type III domain
MARTAAILLLVACLGVASAQLQLCVDQPRIPSPASIKCAGTVNVSPSASDLTFSWLAPQESGTPSCIAEYVVTLYQGGQTNALQTVSVKNSPGAPSNQYTFKNLKPGYGYQISVYGRNPKLGASGEARARTNGCAATVFVPASCIAQCLANVKPTACGPGIRSMAVACILGVCGPVVRMSWSLPHGGYQLNLHSYAGQAGPCRTSATFDTSFVRTDILARHAIAACAAAAVRL